MEIIKNTSKSFYSDFGVFFILLQFIVAKEKLGIIELQRLLVKG